MDLDQGQGKQEEENPDRRIKKERKQIRGSEAAGLEQSKRKCRHSDLSLDEYECNQTASTNDQTAGYQRISPSQIERFHETSNHASQSRGGENRAQPIDGPRAFAATLRNPPKRDRDDGHRDWQVEEKYPPPGSVLNQPASKHRTNCGSDRRETRPCSNCLTAALFIEIRTDDCQAAGHEQCRSH